MVDTAARSVIPRCSGSIQQTAVNQSLRIFANFGPINLNAITCDLSRTVSQGPVSELNHNGIEDRGREMFFLLRMAFWLGLVLVLLPREKTPEMEKAPQVNGSEAVQRATASASDMGQFCKRQPTACQVGGQAATAIGQRAQDGARKLYQIITDKRPPDHTGSIGGPDDTGTITVATSRDTLMTDDLAVEWRIAPTP